MSGDPYSADVRRLFASPAHAGALDHGVTVRRSGNDVVIEISAIAVGPRLESLRFRAYGCPHTLASCEAVCEAFEGQTVEKLADFTAESWRERLDVPVEKTGRLLVLEDTISALRMALVEEASPSGT